MNRLRKPYMTEGSARASTPNAQIQPQARRGMSGGMRGLLDLSRHSGPTFWVALLLLLGSGIAAGFTGHWWEEGWIWAALAILVGVTVGMAWSSRAHYHRLRKVLGMPYFEGNKDRPALPPASEEEISAVQATLRPGLLAAVGFGGIVLIAWLMMFKPF